MKSRGYANAPANKLSKVNNINRLEHHNFVPIIISIVKVTKRFDHDESKDPKILGFRRPKI